MWVSYWVWRSRWIFAKRLPELSVWPCWVVPSYPAELQGQIKCTVKKGWRNECKRAVIRLMIALRSRMFKIPWLRTLFFCDSFMRSIISEDLPCWIQKECLCCKVLLWACKEEWRSLTLYEHFMNTSYSCLVKSKLPAHPHKHLCFLLKSWICYLIGPEEKQLRPGCQSCTAHFILPRTKPICLIILLYLFHLTTFPGRKLFSVTLSKSCPTTKVFQRVLFLFTHFRLWTSLIVSQAQVISHWFGILWIQYFLFVVTAYVTFLKSGRKTKIKLHRMHKKNPSFMATLSVLLGFSSSLYKQSSLFSPQPVTSRRWGWGKKGQHSCKSKYCTAEVSSFSQLP